jgi:DNA-binding transcriptional LysR family regulator
MHPSVRYLHTFSVVCQTGSYRAAAQQLHLTQPAVAYQVRLLEQWADVKLVVRQGRGIRITEAGRRLDTVGHQINEQLGVAVNSIRRGDDKVLRQLRIGTFESFGRQVLIPILKQAAYKSIRVDLRYRGNEAIAAAILQGQCDLGFVYQQPVSNLFRTQKIGDEELVLAVPNAWLDRYDWSKIDTYSKTLFVKYDEGAFVHGRWFETFFKAPPPLLLSDYHFSDVHETLTMVALERGVSVVSRFALQACGSKRISFIRPVKNKRCLNAIYRIERSDQAMSQLADALTIEASSLLQALQQ